ncbi:MAG: hypothetical protein MJ225_04605 [Bacilli bacterium]|nr:hypothetical protein [Bacilli bacterium]
MNSTSFIFIIVSLVVSAVMYIALDNLIIAAMILACYLVVSFMVFIPMIKNRKKQIERYHLCYHFINNFIISLSIKKSIGGAFESTSVSMGSEFQDTVIRIEEMSDAEKLKYLQTYFPFHSYLLFYQIITLWQEQGGDILKMSQYLLAQTRQEEEYITSVSSLGKRKYIETGTLWIFSLAILAMLRFTLTGFYDKIKTVPIFVISTTLLAGFVLFSIYILIKKATNINIKGHDKNEKII